MFGDGDNHGQQKPRGQVVHRGAGDRNGTEARPEQVSLYQNSGQNREGGNAHRGTQKKSERKPGTMPI